MPGDNGTLQFIADKGDARGRLDRMLVRHVKDVSRLSRTSVQDWISAGHVRVDDELVTRAATKVREGAVVSLDVPSTAVRKTRPQAEDVPLRVLYEDEWLLIIDKPAGVAVHPSYKQTSHTLLNAVLWRTRATSSLQPGIVTRLDKDTSGLVLVALRAEVHATLQRDAAAGRISKRYLAIVNGSPTTRAGRITEPIARDPGDRRRMIVAPHGAASETRWERQWSGRAGDEQRAVLACTLITGRTHQIRVHLSSQGWPIIGDRVYGSAHTLIARQALHAASLSLPHPITRAAIHVESQMPADMQALLEPRGTIDTAKRASWPTETSA